MRRTLGAGSWGLVLAIAATAGAGDDPPLTPPADGPPPLEAPGQPVTPAPAPVVTTRKPATSRSTTNLLRPRTAARPVPAPTARPRSETPVSPAPPPFSSTPESIDAPPPLDGPPPLDVLQEIRPLPDRPMGGRPTRRTGPTRPSPLAENPPSLVLEPSQDGDLEPLPDGDDLKGDLENAKRPKISDESPSSKRPARRFGLFPAPVNRSRPGANADSSLRVEPRTDPAADAALKRRLEAKVKDAVGDRARDVEVRVVDRNIVVRVRVDRFWNRRPVRRTIETLPALAGYKAKVEIDD